MPRPRKYMPHGSVIFVTVSLEKGLLLTPNPLSEMIIKSALARACALFPVKVCHVEVEGTHIHMVLVVISPDDTARFVGHFKAETAHRFNALLGWSKRTVWCEGYDSPVILSPRRALMAIAYLYSNPAKDGLEDSIDEYPGFSTWKMFRKGVHSRSWKFISRPPYHRLTPDMHTSAGYSREASRIMRESRTAIEFTIEPDAWLEAFGIIDASEKAKWNELLIKRVRKLEERARRKRSIEKKRVLGARALCSQVLTLDYQPQRTGKRTLCLSDKRSERIRFVKSLKILIREAREVYIRWHTGDYSVSYPPGLFPPALPKLYEPLGYKT